MEAPRERMTTESEQSHRRALLYAISHPLSRRPHRKVCHAGKSLTPPPPRLPMRLLRPPLDPPPPARVGPAETPSPPPPPGPQLRPLRPPPRPPGGPPPRSTATTDQRRPRRAHPPRLSPTKSGRHDAQPRVPCHRPRVPA